jgi:hypothetical protein
MPETQPQYGLPYQRLPGTQRDLTPESMLKQETQTGRQQIQQRFNLAWNEINRSARFIGRTKAERMRHELHTKAQQEMLQFNQQAKQQIAQLRNIDQLAQQGAITNPDEIKARLTLDPAVVKGMYPTPERERTSMQQFADLDIYSHRISDELDRFRVKKPSMLRKLKSISPLATAISTLRDPGKLKIQMWDPDKGEYVDTDKPEDIARYAALLQEEKAIIQHKDELYGQLDISRRTTQSSAGSGFDAGVTGSIKPQRQTPTTTKPKVIRQRNRRTGQERISYDGGKTWQTSG